jgi:hypothetical protein
MAPTPAPTGRVRYAVAAAFMEVLLGVIYSWSVFRGPTLGGWSNTQTITPYRLKACWRRWVLG